MSVPTFLAAYDGDAAPVHSHEQEEPVVVTPGEAVALDMPEGYRTAIRQPTRAAKPSSTQSSPNANSTSGSGSSAS